MSTETDPEFVPTEWGLFRRPPADRPEKKNVEDGLQSVAARVPPAVKTSWNDLVAEIASSAGIPKQTAFAVGLVVACSHQDEWRAMAHDLPVQAPTEPR